MPDASVTRFGTMGSGCEIVDANPSGIDSMPNDSQTCENEEDGAGNGPHHLDGQNPDDSSNSTSFFLNSQAWPVTVNDPSLTTPAGRTLDAGALSIWKSMLPLERTPNLFASVQE